MMNEKPVDILVIEGNENERIFPIAALMRVDSITVISFDLASVLFLIFLMLSIVSLVMGNRGRHPPHPSNDDYYSVEYLEFC